MRKAALLCGTLSLAVFVSFYLLPESVLLPAAGVCALLSALSLLLPRGKGRARAHLALLGAAIGLFAFFVQEHFLAAPSDALAGEKRVISVRVTDYPDIYDTSEYITVRVRDPDLPGVKCRIASYDTENFTALTPGDELSVPVKLLPARERNGQSVDTYAAQGIFLRATATGAPVNASIFATTAAKSSPDISNTRCGAAASASAPFCTRPNLARTLAARLYSGRNSPT